MEPIGTIAALLGSEDGLVLDAADAAPAGPGAYALVIGIDRPVSCALARRSIELGRGCYVYAGSAYGPGGIRARLARHFRRDKKPHWHVDRLTMAASAISALAFEGGSECAIVESLSNSPGFAPAFAGFGSSDCRTCESHLLRWQGWHS